MRAAAQLISYEVAQGLSLVGVVMMVGSLSLVDIVKWQETHIWMVVPQFVGFLIFMVAGFAETNRAPFDLAEADAELVGGYNTEYGGGRFAAFFAAEYLNVVVVSALIVTLFFGGWDVPFWDQPNWIEPIVVIVKMLRLRLLLHLGPRDAPAPALRPADVVRLEDPAAAGDAQCPCDRDPRGGARLMPYDPGDVVEVHPRAARQARRRAPTAPSRRRCKGLKMTFGRMRRGPDDDQLPRGEDAGLPALPRAPQAPPLRGHGAGEVRRLLAVRGGLPGGLHPRGGGREHAGEPRQRRRALRRGVRDQPVALHLLRLLRDRVPVRRDHAWATTTRWRTTTGPT